MFLTTVLWLAVLTATATASKPNPHHNPPPPGINTNTTTWHTINKPHITPKSPTTFTLTTPPATDLWRPNVTANNFTAPYIYTTCLSSAFKSISVTLSSNWKTRYDQGGIAVFFPTPDHRHRDGHQKGKGRREPLKWVKTGIEFENSAPQFGTVGTYAFSDWSLSPAGPNKGRFVVERSTTEMWVYAVLEDGRYPLREVTWAFLEERGREGAEV